MLTHKEMFMSYNLLQGYLFLSLSISFSLSSFPFSLSLSLRKSGIESQKRQVIDLLTKLFCLVRLYHIALTRFTVKAEQRSGVEGLTVLGSKA